MKTASVKLPPESYKSSFFRRTSVVALTTYLKDGSAVDYYIFNVPLIIAFLKALNIVVYSQQTFIKKFLIPSLLINC